MRPGVEATAANPGSTSAGQGRRWRVAAWGSAALMLLLPLLAMQFTDEVDWTVSDFAVFGAMLAGVGGTCELTLRKTANRAYRAAVGVALATAFMLVWVNGAVGIIGSEDNPANLMFGGVLAVGLIGAAIVRFRAAGMAGALVATAFAQGLVAVIALVTGAGSIFVATACFVALWLTSAWLFRQAAQG